MAQTGLRVLVVDDDPGIVRTLLLGLKVMGCQATGVESGEAALKALAEAPADVLLTDMRMEGMSGVELVEEAHRRHPALVSVVMTAFASYENAVSAIKAGAYDYLPKPFTSEQLEHLVGKVSQLVALRKENASLRAGQGDWFDGLTSPKSQRLQTLVERIAPSEATVLLRGETGSGKTELARSLHRRSPRADKPFVEVTCTAIAENLFESEVFGHVRGAFTGAVRDRPGKFEMADGGTLFLDEIGELSATAQAKLLRFLEDRVIERVGDNKPLRLDVRILAATNRDLAAMMKDGSFREDLYYRLNVFECVIPPLRERPEDIAPLAAKLLRAASAKYGPPPTLSKAVQGVLLGYAWPGNVRELRNVMERLALLAAGREATPEDLPPALAGGPAEADAEDGGRILTLREVEARHIRHVLSLGVSMERAAELLGINTVTLWRKRKELGA
ncbi:MAG TPA: sigma-54 dependent transcriptional regulator [Candidatus Bilophila faecipullorum]|uniref:Sigma-54 dependent transcriptional regulator n=1 Tax=Candidatus Bilophila faecipullorum TaxID=2838482 RepID=A0A9D1QZ84_9BACT|nr:sigma-54 dependent transcriptional regulator [uncultured Bilophila sp.]HIW77979.1 sigma-54 dependent transcriptional regulator [Candidatus Bilophila faecipullorum]